ncbi:MAG: N-glycosylase/DNA lyase [Candidatus Delongbacteria bacterium]|nr:N-glycosylase/DNA lyase [Candidatus Delongbacteria bacterium]
MTNNNIKELQNIYKTIEKDTTARIDQFKSILENYTEDQIFAELCFCLFTPQSKAVSCWSSIERLVAKDLLLNGTAPEIINEIKGVRFHNNKTGYLLEVRERYLNGDLKGLKNFLTAAKPFELREWLFTNIKGYGIKEASHFLRNAGLGDELAILDRHILKNLVIFGVIEEIPKALNKKVYYDIEKKMKTFSKKIKIPMDHLDLLFWYKEAGEIFK